MFSDKSKHILGLTPSLVILIMSHLLFLSGLSMIIAQWQTDRMLYWEIVRSQHLLSVLSNTHLDGAISQLQILKDNGYGFQIIGLILLIFGIIGIIGGCYTTKYDGRKLRNLSKKSVPAIRLSGESLVIIFSSAFALALIFISINVQIISDLHQTFNSILLQIEDNPKISDNALLLMNEILKNSTFNFGFNTLNAVYFTIIGITYVIAYTLRHIQTNSRLIFHNHLIIMGLVSFVAWVIFYVLYVGVTTPSSANFIVKSPFE